MSGMLRALGLFGTLTRRQRPHNLLLWSEQFENAVWVKTTATVSANVANAPDGATTADKLVESGTGIHRAEQFPTVADNVTLTWSVSVRAAERGFAYLEGRTKAGAFPGAFFNLTTGAATAVVGGATASSQSLGNGWFRCSITFNAGAGASSVYVGVQTAIGGTSFSDRSYTGDGTSGIFIWGAQLNQGDLQPYRPTVGAAV